MNWISLNTISGADDLGGVPAQVPVEGPELGEFDQLGVAIGETHVDRARQGLAFSHPNLHAAKRSMQRKTQIRLHFLKMQPDKAESIQLLKLVIAEERQGTAET
ncbi:MAG: hypothetical protein ABSG59_18235 [Verrucomicrobiota bacterium]|jgi:hypothetical protein